MADLGIVRLWEGPYREPTCGQRVLCDIRIMDTHTINLELWGEGGHASRSSRICSTEAARSDPYQHSPLLPQKKKYTSQV